MKITGGNAACPDRRERASLQNPGEASLEGAFRGRWRPSGGQLDVAVGHLDAAGDHLGAAGDHLEAIWARKLHIYPQFTIKRNFDVTKPPKIHTFRHSGPPNLTFIPLFTYQSPLFKNAIKHQFLHAFVQWLKT